jgi:hypothetical protein
VLHQIQGTIAAFSTQIGGVSFASAGMTCRTCEKEGFRLDMMQIATHPLLTPAPTVHPIIVAAHSVLAKLRSTRVQPPGIERAA